MRYVVVLTDGKNVKKVEKLDRKPLSLHTALLIMESILSCAGRKSVGVFCWRVR